MAEWRAIHRKITTAWDVAQLSRLGKILFTWGIVCADNYGILEDDLGAIKLSVLSGEACELDEIEGQLTAMESLGLIWRYQTDTGTHLFQFRCFDDYQPKEILRKRGKSKWPVHWDWQPPDDIEGRPMPEKADKGRQRPEKAPRERDREREERETDGERQQEIDPDSFVYIWEHTTGQVIRSEYFAQELMELRDKYTAELFRGACQEGMKTSNGPISLKYIMSICDGCLRDGRKPGEGKHGKPSRSNQLTPEQLAEYFPEA